MVEEALISIHTSVDLDRTWMRTVHSYKNRNWRLWPIQENDEKLVLADPAFCHPWYALEMELTNDTRLYVRQRVYNMFLYARELAQDQGYELKLLDGWRSVHIQELLFWHYMKEFTVAKFGFEGRFSDCHAPDEVRQEFLRLSEEDQRSLRESNRTFVSWPSSDPVSPSPHTTGGSLDVWLYQDGKQVDLGVPFDWMEESAGAFYHLKSKRISFGEDDSIICQRRTVLLRVMLMAGFTAYPPELWHWNHGNQMDACVRQVSSACYSYIEP